MILFYQVMATLCCVVKKATSAAQQSIYLLTGILQKLVITKRDHHHCPISVHILTTLELEAVIEIHCWGLWLLKWGVGSGGRRGSLLYLLPPAWQIGEVNRCRLCAQDSVPPLSYNCLFLHLPLSRSKLDRGRWKNPHCMRIAEVRSNVPRRLFFAAQQRIAIT